MSCLVFVVTISTEVVIHRRNGYQGQEIPCVLGDIYGEAYSWGIKFFCQLDYEFEIAIA